jgi:hypothetical protein
MTLVNHRLQGSDRKWWVAVAVLIAGAAGPPAGLRPASLRLRTGVEPPAGKLYHGVSPGGRNCMGADIAPSDVLAYERALNKLPAWVYFWNHWYESPQFPFQTASWIRASGSMPYMRLMLLSSPKIPRPDPVYSLENILAGKFDPLLRKWMRDARGFGSPLIAEYGTEMNGWWFPWNGLYNRGHGTYADSVARFRAAYRHVIQLAREERACNIRWVFHVDPWDEPLRDWNRFENYYPGDEWIDWVGVSVYGRQLPNDARGLFSLLDGLGLRSLAAAHLEAGHRLRVRDDRRSPSDGVDEGCSRRSAGRPLAESHRLFLAECCV